MVDWTKPIETIGGKSARVLSTNLLNCTHPIVIAYIVIDDGQEFVTIATTEGTSIGGETFRNKKQKVWFNLYLNKPIEPFDESIVTGFGHITEEEARKCRLSDCLATVEVEI